MHDFEYVKASSAAEASKQLREHAGAMVLAGGMWLVPRMKRGVIEPPVLVDVAGAAALKDIRVDGDAIVVGALVTHSQLAESDVVRSHAPILGHVAASIGDPQVRNRGTLGGGLVAAESGYDHPASLLALDGKVKTSSRTIDAEAFVAGKPRVAKDEVVEAVRFMKPTRAAYVKMPKPTTRGAIVGVLAAEVGGSVRIAVTGAAETPFRLRSVEQALGAKLDLAAIPAHIDAGCALIDDVHASAEFRAHLLGVILRRAVRAAIDGTPPAP